MIREEVIQIVGYELDDPRIDTVTVTDVRVADNLRDASVYVTAEGTEAERVEALKALQRAAAYVRRQLGMALNLRFTPEVHFVRDTVEESATRVEALLTQLQQERPPDDEAPPEASSGQGERGDNSGE